MRQMMCGSRVFQALLGSPNFRIQAQSFPEVMDSRGWPQFTRPSSHRWLWKCLDTKRRRQEALYGVVEFWKLILSGSDGYTGGGLNKPVAVAVDGSGKMLGFLTQVRKTYLAAASLSSRISGALLREIMDTAASACGIDAENCGSASPISLAIDGSGDVWITNNNGGIVEMIGVATPAVTPLAVGVANNALGPPLMPSPKHDKSVLTAARNHRNQIFHVVPHIPNRSADLPGRHFLGRVGPEQIDWRPRRVEWSQPAFVIAAGENHRHPGMDRGREFVSLRGEYAEGFERLLRGLVFPPLPDAGEGVERTVLQADRVGLLRLGVQLRPLVKT